MMNFTGQQFSNEFKDAFGMDASALTPKQRWWLLKFAKHCRGRCRSNAALHNYLNDNMPGAKFVTVEKRDPKTGQSYLGTALVNNGLLEHGGDE